MVFANYAANDSKVYSPTVFCTRLETLGRKLERDFPGAVLIFSTSMYCDPKHAAPYHIDHFQVPGFKEGSLRNEYLEPYNQQIREFAGAHGYRLADIFRRITEETERDNWDLRIRAGEGDPSEDSKHEGDMTWSDNIHPNFKGLRSSPGSTWRFLPSQTEPRKSVVKPEAKFSINLSRGGVVGATKSFAVVEEKPAVGNV